MAKAFFNNSYAITTNMPVGSTYYFNPGQSYSGFLDAVEANVKTSLFATGTLSHLAAYVPTNGAGATSTVRVRKNGANGNMTLSIGASSTGAFLDSTNTDSITSGDDLDTQFASGAGGSSLLVSSIGYIYTDADSATTFFSAFAAISAVSTSRYFCFTNGPRSGALTEAPAQYKAKSAGTFTGLSVYIKTNGRASSATVIRTRKNASNGNCSISATASTTGIFEDSSSTDTVSVDELWNLVIVSGAGSGSVTTDGVSITFVGSGDYTPMINAAHSGKVLNQNTTTYFAYGGELDGSTTQGNTHCNTNFAAESSKLACSISANTVSAASTLRFRINNADGNQSVSITASTTGHFEDASNTDSFAATDEVNYSLVTGAGGTSLTVTILASLIKQGGTAYTSSLSDTVVVADSIAKMAGKGLTEAVVIAEVITRVITRSFIDAVTIVANAYNMAGKAFAETVTFVDSISVLRIVNVVLSEIVTLVETFVRTISRTFTDAVEVIDTFGKTISRTFTETILIVETFVKMISRSFTETLAIVEAFTKTTARLLADSIAISEVFLKTWLLLFTEIVTVTSHISVFLNGIRMGLWAGIDRISGAWSGMARVASNTWDRAARIVTDWTKIDRQ